MDVALSGNVSQVHDDYQLPACLHQQKEAVSRQYLEQHLIHPKQIELFMNHMEKSKFIFYQQYLDFMQHHLGLRNIITGRYKHYKEAIRLAFKKFDANSEQVSNKCATNLLVYTYLYLEFYRIFGLLDRNRSDHVSMADFQRPQTQEILRTIGLEFDSPIALFRQIDTNNGKLVDFQEFFEYFTKINFDFNTLLPPNLQIQGYDPNYVEDLIEPKQQVTEIQLQIENEHKMNLDGCVAIVKKLEEIECKMYDSSIQRNHKTSIRQMYSTSRRYDIVNQQFIVEIQNIFKQNSASIELQQFKNLIKGLFADQIEFIQQLNMEIEIAFNTFSRKGNTIKTNDFIDACYLFLMLALVVDNSFCLQSTEQQNLHVDETPNMDIRQFETAVDQINSLGQVSLDAEGLFEQLITYQENYVSSQDFQNHITQQFKHFSCARKAQFYLDSMHSFKLSRALQTKTIIHDLPDFYNNMTPELGFLFQGLYGNTKQEQFLASIKSSHQNNIDFHKLQKELRTLVHRSIISDQLMSIIITDIEAKYQHLWAISEDNFKALFFILYTYISVFFYLEQLETLNNTVIFKIVHLIQGHQKFPKNKQKHRVAIDQLVISSYWNIELKDSLYKLVLDILAFLEIDKDNYTRQNITSSRSTIRPVQPTSFLRSKGYL